MTKARALRNLLWLLVIGLALLAVADLSATPAAGPTFYGPFYQV